MSGSRDKGRARNPEGRAGIKLGRVVDGQAQGIRRLLLQEGYTAKQTLIVPGQNNVSGLFYIMYDRLL